VDVDGPWVQKDLADAIRMTHRIWRAWCRQNRRAQVSSAHTHKFSSVQFSSVQLQYLCFMQSY